MAGVRAVDDLTAMSGKWILCATSLGYFDRRPRVDSATLDYRTLSPERVAFTVRYRVGSTVHMLRGRQASRRSSDGLFRFRGWGALLRVTRLRWDLAMADTGDIVIAANAGTLISPPGVMVFAREDASRAEVRRRLEADPRSFGVTTSQLRLFYWRSEAVAA